MSAAERVAHWSFGLGLYSTLAAAALLGLGIVLTQVWLIAYWNPWGFSLFPLGDVLRSLALVCFVLVGFSVGCMFWNMTLR